eukprot:1160789-Pelagomonas_calceolata.AAC.5
MVVPACQHKRAAVVIVCCRYISPSAHVGLQPLCVPTDRRIQASIHAEVLMLYRVLPEKAPGLADVFQGDELRRGEGSCEEHDVRKGMARTIDECQ